MRSAVAIIVLFGVGCGSAATTDRVPSLNEGQSTEERAVLDALERFVRRTRANEISIEPSQYLARAPIQIGGASVTILTREELVDRHRGSEAAPLIATINLWPTESETATQFRVEIAQFLTAASGFELIPYGMIATYTYRAENDSLIMLAESVETE